MKPGLHTLDAAQYHQDPCDQPSLSASIAHLLVTASPAHARAAHPKLNPDFKQEDDSKFDIGTVAHKLILEGLNVIEVVNADSWRAKWAQEARDVARAHGRVPLLPHHAEEVERMVEAVWMQISDLEVDPFPFQSGDAEQTLVWDENGVTCRARIDWLHPLKRATIDDLKTTSRYANPEAWQRGPLYDHGCDLQAAFYLRGLRAVTGVEATWRWVVVETRAPYALSVISPAASVLAIGDAKVEKALTLWKRCLETGEWPAYPREVVYAELPAWIESAWLEREARWEEFQIAMLAATALDDTQDVRDELKKPPWTCAWCSETNHHEGVICMACSRYGQPGAGNVWGPERMRHDPERS